MYSVDLELVVMLSRCIRCITAVTYADSHGTVQGDDTLPDVCTGFPALDSIKSRCNQGAAAEVSKAAIHYIPPAV